jgi:hypothetical protein
MPSELFDIELAYLAESVEYHPKKPPQVIPYLALVAPRFSNGFCK